MLDEKNLNDLSNEKSMIVTLEQVLDSMNGTDSLGDPLTWGSIQNNHVSNDGTISVITQYELSGAIYQINIRDNFIHLSVDFPKNARASLVLLKKILFEFDQLCLKQEDFLQGSYYIHMVLLPTAFMGQFALVLRNVVLWIDGMHPFDRDVQRMTLLFERSNCMFVSTEEINMVSVRAEIERDIRQQYDIEKRFILEQEAADMEQQEADEGKISNDYMMKLAGMGNMEKQGNEIDFSRIRFSDSGCWNMEDDWEDVQ